jgi:hypothetical protein
LDLCPVSIFLKSAVRLGPCHLANTILRSATLSNNPEPPTMDGFMLAVSANSASKGKQQWQTVFLKADEISAKLIAFSDRSQSQIRWSLGLVSADISTPVPGEPNFGISIDETPYCFYVRETSATSDCTYFFSASDDAAKKRWMKTLLQIARDGPKTPRFAATQAENDFAFNARVVKFRPHEQGAHAVGTLTSYRTFAR